MGQSVRASCLYVTTVPQPTYAKGTLLMTFTIDQEVSRKRMAGGMSCGRTFGAYRLLTRAFLTAHRTTRGSHYRGGGGTAGRQFLENACMYGNASSAVNTCNSATSIPVFYLANFAGVVPGPRHIRVRGVIT